MFQRADIDYNITNVYLLGCIPEYIMPNMKNVVIPISEIKDYITNKHFNLLHIVDMELGTELYIGRSWDTNLVCIDDNLYLDVVYRKMNKKARSMKRCIEQSMSRHRLYKDSIGLYCNLPKFDFMSVDADNYKKFQTIELLVSLIFKLNLRCTRVCTTYTMRYRKDEDHISDNCIHLSSYDNDVIGACRFILDATSCRSHGAYAFNHVTIKCCGDLDMIIHELTNHCNISEEDSLCRNNISVLQNKVLELEIDTF